MKIPVEGGTPVAGTHRQRSRTSAGARRIRVVLCGSSAEPQRFAGLRTARGASREWPIGLAGANLRPAVAAMAGLPPGDFERRKVAGACRWRTLWVPISGLPLPSMENYDRSLTLDRNALSSPAGCPGHRTENGSSPQWAKAIPISCSWTGSCGSLARYALISASATQGRKYKTIRSSST